MAACTERDGRDKMQPIAVGHLLVGHPEGFSRSRQIEQNQLRQHEEVDVSHGRPYPSTSAVDTTCANRPSSTSSVRSRISAVENVRPGAGLHGEGQCRIAHKAHFKPCIGGVSRGRFATLLGANACYQDLLDAVARSQLSSVTPEVVLPYSAECTSL